MDIFSPRIGPFRSPSPPRTLEVVAISHTNVPTIYCVVLATMPLTLVPAILILPNPYHISNVWKSIRLSVRRCFSWIFGGSPSRPLTPPEDIEMINIIQGDTISIDEDQEKVEFPLAVCDGAGEGDIVEMDILPSTEPVAVAVETLPLEGDQERDNPEGRMDLSHITLGGAVSSTPFSSARMLSPNRRQSPMDTPKESRPSSLMYSTKVRHSPSDVSFRRGRSSSSINARPRWRP